MLRNILLFPETLKTRIYHIQTIYVYALLACVILALLSTSKSVYKKFQEGYKQWFRESRNIYKYFVIWGLVVFFAWSVTSISYYMWYIDEEALLAPTQITAPMSNFVERWAEYYNRNIKQLEYDPQAKEMIQLVNSLAALYVTIFLTLGGITISFSYGNKMLRNIGIFLIYISVGIYIIFLLFQHREHDLFTDEIPLETNPF